MFNALHQPRAGYHLLRVAVAAMMLMHGVSKVLNGVAGIERMLVAHGLPSWVAYGVYLGEVVAPLLVIANRFVGPAALVMAVNMLFAIGLAHAGDILTLRNTGAWGIELQALFLVGSIAIALQAPPARVRG